MTGDQVFLLNLPDEIQHLLGAPHREGRDDHIAAPVHSGLDPLGQLLDIVHPLLAVEPVAVGGLDHQILRIPHKLRVAQNGLAAVAQVAGKGDLPGLPVLGEPYLDG